MCSREAEKPVQRLRSILIILPVHHHHDLFAACAIIEIVYDAGGNAFCVHEKFKRSCRQCIQMTLPVDHPSKKGNLSHVCTETAGDSILEDGKILCSKSLHGTSKAVWAAGTFAGALGHALTAKRHHEGYRACGYWAYCFTIHSGSQQRHLFRKRKQGYCTSSTYDGLSGQDVEVDCEKVTCERFNLLEYFKKDQFVKCGHDDYVVDSESDDATEEDDEACNN